jgi:uncharacterized protein (TIGR00304 family)
MNRRHLLPLVFFISGIVFFSLGILTKEMEIGVVLIFPFMVGSGIYALLGFISIFIATMLFMIGFLSKFSSDDLNVRKKDIHQTNKKTSVKGGGVILIGPIPIVFGTNWKIALMLMMLAMIAITVFFIFKQF